MKDEILTVEKIFSRGSTILIHFSEEIGAVKKFAATVLAPENTGYVLKINEDEHLPQIKVGAEITISYKTPNDEEYIFGSYLIQKIASNTPLLIVAQPINTNFTTLRRFHRFEVKLPFNYQLNNEKKNGLVLNISASGLFARIALDPNLKVGQTINIELIPSKQHSIQLNGKIVRIELDNDNQAIAVDFEDIDAEVRENLLKFLLYG